MKNNALKQPIVIDTNVLVSALLFPTSMTAQAVSKALIEFNLFLSQQTFDEFVEVIQRPKFAKYFIQREHEINDFIEDLMIFAFIIEVTHQVTDCQDPKDNKFLEVALSANALYLVTGDKKDLISMNPYHGIEIITVKEFLEREMLE